MSRRILLGIGATLCLGWALVGSVHAGPIQMKVNSDPEQVHIWHATDAVLTYHRRPGPFKPYVKQLYTPSGRNILLDSPSDHAHHHGLMLAYSVAGVNFWEEIPQCGFQIPQPGLSVWSQAQEQTCTAGFSCDIDWRTPDKEVVLQETRRIEALGDAQYPATLVTWTSSLRGPQAGQAVHLTGSHYFGLGMRFVRAMDETGEFINANKDPGTVFRGDERLARGRWCAYRVDLNGQAVTVAIFAHPNNPRPVTWFTMKTPFAYLAATLNLHEEPYILPVGQTLRLCYGVAVWDGRQTPQRIEQTYRHWLSRQARR